ncbi:putative killer cell immunoglobulin-like receptor like protein KIR3DP1 isoform X2 [Cervus canadensis]|uniref:putative killer cell immunoglobulin-like receptor like protein KIR3DP1 isoform X2 n=1 Tax=Cervus canadensis TaxID=1574408 RepID=UPI001CA35283|nr:putative killer cell immunoglobulin-like receptor like protein KIR3DP1 isoform X2 [Cervus canadensis]
MWPSLLSLLSLGFSVSLRIWAAVGEYDKPSLSAWPSPVVPLGQSVTLRCHSSSPFTVFRLFKRDGTSLPKLREHQLNTFTLGPVTREHAGSYTCSGAYTSRSVRSTHSDPLQIVVTGVFTKPDISAHPGPIVRAGENVTIRCHSPLLLDKFMLHKKGSNGHFQRRGETFTGRRAPADFSVGPMTLASAGTYRCYGSLSRSLYEWSAPSDPVDIVITGLSKKPSLSAQGGPVVRSGENVTLLCSSERAFDQFHLIREGENLGRPLAGGRGPGGALQAAFPLGPGTPAHSGAYRCYGSFTRSPYAWSDPSDPLLLCVTGSTTTTYPSTMDPHTTEEAGLPQEHSSMLYVVFGLVIAFTSTSFILAALVCHWCSTQNLEWTGSATWATPLPFSGFVVPIKVTEVWNNCLHPEEP